MADVNTSGPVTMTTQRFTYNFATQGGAIGSITLTGGAIPANAFIVLAATKITTAIEGGVGCSITFSLESAGDINGAFDPATFPLLPGYNSFISDNGAVGIKGTIVQSTGSVTANTIVTTAARSVVLAITGAALISGKVDIYLTYVISS